MEKRETNELAASRIKGMDIRNNNVRLIMKMFLEHDYLAVNDISEQINLSKTTVAKLINGLMANGLIEFAGKGSSTNEGGKRPSRFCLNGSWCYFISIMYSTQLKSLDCALFDLSLRVIGKLSMPVEEDVEYQDILQKSAEMVHSCIDEYQIPQEKIFGVIYCGTGIIDSSEGILISPVATHWDANLPLKADLEKRLELSCPVFFDNGCRYLGLAELYLSQAVLPDSYVTIYTSDATGGSYIRHGAVVSGERGFVGEVGFLMVDYNCMKTDNKEQNWDKGLFSPLVAPSRLVKIAYEQMAENEDSVLYKKLLEGKLHADDIFNAANSGDRYARSLLDTVIRYFVIAIHNIAYVHDVNYFILQGVYDSAGEYFLSELNRLLNSITYDCAKIDITVRYSTLDFRDTRNDNFLFGGACSTRQYWLSHVDISI